MAKGGGAILLYEQYGHVLEQERTPVLVIMKYTILSSCIYNNYVLRLTKIID